MKTTRADPMFRDSRLAAFLYEPFVAALTAGRYRGFVGREVERLAPRPGDRALDLCCGTGLVTRELARRVGPGGEVVAVDASPAMLELAGRRVRGEVASTVGQRDLGRADLAARGGGAPVSFVLADAAALPLPDGEFDLATIFLGLHEVDGGSRREALREVRRVLRPGGRGVVLDFAAGGPPARRHLVRWALTALEGPDAWTITDPGLEALLRSADLGPAQRRPVFGGVLEVVAFQRP